MKKYPNGDNLLLDLSLKSNNNCVTLESSSKLTLDISFLKDFGWELEVRYDLLNKKFNRTIYTGEQENFKREKLDTKTNKKNIEIHTGKNKIIIDKSSAQFEIYKDNILIMRTSSIPLSAKLEPVLLDEGTSSVEEADMTERFKGIFDIPQYESHLVRFQYEKPEGLILGIPSHAGEMNRNSGRYELYNTDCGFIAPNSPMYQSWPILFHPTKDNQNWLGIFHDNISRTFLDIGEFFPNYITFDSYYNNTRVFICSGENLNEVSQSIASLLGKHCSIPKWAFGYQQSRWSYQDSQKMSEIAKRFREEEIPCDAIYFDIDYMDNFKLFTHNKETFPNLKACIKDLEKEGFHSICILDPGVKIEKDYSIYEDFNKVAKLTNEDGSDFVARVWPGKCILPDFNDKETKELWGDNVYKWLNKFPFSGIWNDMNEPSNFDGHNRSNRYAFTKRGSLEKEHNLYGFGMAKATRAGWKKYSDSPGLVITRSGYPGVQQHSVNWHGDNSSLWEHLQLAITQAVTYSLCGAFYTGTDIPGFSKNPSNELAVRFFQLGTLLPFYRGHSCYGSKAREPFSFSEPIKAIIKESILLRYSLITEWITAFEIARESFISPLAPILDEKNNLIKDQFILFDKMLVAPVIRKDQKQKFIYLPKGLWYAFGNNEETIDGNCWLAIDIELDTIPIFIKAGNIICLNMPGKNVDDTLKNDFFFEPYLDQSSKASSVIFTDKLELMKYENEEIIFDSI